MNYIGWDLSTKRSGITSIGPNSGRGFKVLARWNKGPSTKNPGQVITFFENTVVKVFEPQPPSVVAIDWSLAEAHMRGNKRFTLLKAMVAGLVFTKLKEYGHLPTFIAPAEVRRQFDLGNNAKKKDVALAFANDWRREGFSVGALNNLNEHTLDALILAYVASKELHHNSQYSAFLEVSHDF